jgi:protein-S-isoprenylcysteine O-methyltransferase Ste14
MKFRKEKIRVYAAWTAALVVVWSSRTQRFCWWGIGVAGLGLALRIWASGHLRKNQSLTSSGPYAYTRNPLYLGTSVIGAGFLVAVHQALFLLILAPLFWVLYRPVIVDEERILEELFGDQFREYQRYVPQFFPRIGPGKSELHPSRFSWRNLVRNREYDAILGFFLSLLCLYLLGRPA